MGNNKFLPVNLLYFYQFITVYSLDGSLPVSCSATWYKRELEPDVNNGIPIPFIEPDFFSHKINASIFDNQIDVIIYIEKIQQH